jgi:hypothetical protein
LRIQSLTEAKKVETRIHINFFHFILVLLPGRKDISDQMRKREIHEYSFQSLDEHRSSLKKRGNSNLFSYTKFPKDKK